MMEGIVAPEHSRKAMGNRLLGCDLCQRVCPMQSGAEKDTSNWRIDDFMTLDDQAFAAQLSSLAQRIGRNVVRPQRVRAQIALLCGNIGKESDLPVLCKWAESDFDAVREHARWAISQIETKRTASHG